MKSEDLEGIRRALLKWYGRRRRDLPWRRSRATLRSSDSLRSTSDPYRVWVSEIMLQQTQVETVKPYFRRFLRRFPSVHALAEAPADAVMKAWEGLGYYARARNLHRAAKIVSSGFRSRWPESPEELMKLPGIGRSTAGAISSIAFGRDAPVLDGNVVRVLCRVFRVRRNPRESRTQRRLWEMAQNLLPPNRAGDFNQALMDLGATICVPRNPRCGVCPAAKRFAACYGVCPLAAECLARAHGDQDKLPAKTKRKPLPHYDVAVGVIRRGKRLLIDRRKPEGLLGGLWEFPGGKRKENESLEHCLAREIHEELGIRVKIVRPLMSVPHAYTHFRITLHVYECRYLSGRPRAIGCAGWRWVRPDELDRYAFPSANRKIIAELLKRKPRERPANLTEFRKSIKLKGKPMSQTVIEMRRQERF